MTFDGCGTDLVPDFGSTFGWVLSIILWACFKHFLVRSLLCVTNNLLFSFLEMGAYHTIDLQLNQKFTLAKEHWDYVALDRLGMEFVLSIPFIPSFLCCIIN